MRPLILITNDDGVGSPHVLALADALEDLAEVIVVAPERQRSAASHAITLHKPLRLHEVAPRRFSLSGTPADCVYLGVLKLALRPPALVLSGINDGYNLGSDVFYSGTVAGAIEGALRGSVGVAISMAPHARGPAGVVRFVRALVAKALAEPLPPGNVLNVNAPGAPDGDAEVAWTVLGKRRYQDDVAERADPRGKPYYWIGGGVSGHDEIAGSDCDAVARGAISVTPLNLDLTHRSHVQAPPWDLAAKW